MAAQKITACINESCPLYSICTVSKPRVVAYIQNDKANLGRTVVLEEHAFTPPAISQDIVRVLNAAARHHN